jgi:hypothetical protein
LLLRELLHEGVRWNAAFMKADNLGSAFHRQSRQFANPTEIVFRIAVAMLELNSRNLNLSHWFFPTLFCRRPSIAK